MDDPNDHSMAPASLPNGTTWIYEYDLGGNILRKTWFPYTTAEHPTGGTTITYEYNNANWRDQLTMYDGHTITYDPIGNPLNDGTWNYTWQNGRQLASMEHGTETDADYKKLIFRYNADGLRVQKEFIHKVGTQLVTEVTKYTLHGKNVVHMTRGNDEMHFWYDAQNRPAMVEFNGNKYTYIHNLQGDIVGILDTNGSEVVKYMYDAWGKPIGFIDHTDDHLGTVQPFRYRGYVFDEETVFYYLRSRYSNPIWCRFSNPDQDITVDISWWDAKQYTYCANNPIRYDDASGLSFWDSLKKVAQVALAVSAVIVVAAVVIGTGGGAGFAIAGGGALATSAVSGAMVSAATVTGAAGATALGIAETGIYFSKTTSKSGKDKSSDKPSWVNKSQIDPNLSAQENATKLLNNKYGQDNWIKGPGSEYNKIVKWIQRSLFNK